MAVAHAVDVYAGLGQVAARPRASVPSAKPSRSMSSAASAWRSRGAVLLRAPGTPSAGMPVRAEQAEQPDHHDDPEDQPEAFEHVRDVHTSQNAAGRLKLQPNPGVSVLQHPGETVQRAQAGAPPWRPGSPARRARAARACRCSRRPRCDTASTTAFQIAGVEPIAPDSPMPFAPSGLSGLGVWVRSVS